MTAFVTGGGGFIGRHLVRRLREAGTEVRAIARSEASAVQLRAAGCEVVIGDVLDSAALRTALEGCSVARPPRLSTPTWALRAAAPIVSRIGPNVSELIRSSAGVTYWATNAKARRELGYAARDLDAGLSATFG